MDYSGKSVLSRPAALALALAFTLAAYCFALALSSGSDSPLGSAIRLSTSPNREVSVSGDRLYYLEGGSLHCVSSEGKYLWNIGVDANSSFTATEYGVAVWNGARITLIDSQNGYALASQTMDAEILSARMGDTYAAILLAPEHNSTVVLTDRYASVVDTLTDFSGVTALDYGFFIGHNLFWIMTLDSSGSLPTCSINTYTPGKRNDGSITDMEQVLYQVMFHSSHIAVVGMNYMRVYDYRGNEQADERKTVYGWYLEAVDKVSDNPLMLFVPNAQIEGTPLISDVRMIRGGVEHIVHLPVACSQIEASNGTLYGFAGQYLAVCNFGNHVSNVYKLPITVDNVIGITSDKVAVCTMGGSIYLIKLI